MNPEWRQRTEQIFKCLSHMLLNLSLAYDMDKWVLSLGS